MQHQIFRHAIQQIERQGNEEDIFHLEAPTTFSHRSHKSGCVLLLPTYSRCRQQRAHFWKAVFVTVALASFAPLIVRSLKIKNSSSSSLLTSLVTFEFEWRTTAASSALPISFS